MNEEYIKTLNEAYNQVADRRELLHMTDEWNRNTLGEQMGAYRRRIESLGGKVERVIK